MGDNFKPVIVAYGSISPSKTKARNLVPQSKQPYKAPIIPGLNREKDNFRPIIAAYGSISPSKNKARKLGPLSKRPCRSPIIPGLSREKKDKLKQLSIVQTINLASSPDRKTKQVIEDPSDEVIALSPPSASGSGSRSTKDKAVSTEDSSAVVNLDDDVITLSPDLVPFSIPQHADLSQNSDSRKVLAVVTLEEQSPPTKQPVSDTPEEDPLQVVITLPESPDLITLADSPSEVIMDTAAGKFTSSVDDLMEQINSLIVQNEPSEKNQSKAIAKVNSRLSNADPGYVQSEAFATLLETCVKEIKKDGATLYVQLKIILEKLKQSSQAATANVTESSSTDTLAPEPSTSSTPSAPPPTLERKRVVPTPLETSRVNRTPITLDTSTLKRYDKANYETAMEWFEQLIGIIEDTEPDKALSGGIVSKLRTRLEKAEKKYLYSTLCLNTLKFTINGILTDPGKIYGFIRQTVDELKANMKCPDGVEQPKPSTSKAKDSDEDGDKGSDQSENEDSGAHAAKAQPDVDVDEGLDEKTRAHIRKLEKTLRKLEKVIRKLDQEDCWGSGDEEEDDANSAYVKQERYMERYMKIFNKIFELRGRKPDLGRPIHSKVRFECTEYPAINRTIERFYNKTHQFPDYGDMLVLVQKVSETSSLGLSPGTVQHIAEKAFTSFGEILKQRRMEDDYDVFITRLGTEEDPAAHDETLAQKLEENKKHWAKIDEVINKYVVIQEEKKKKGGDEGKEDEDEEEDDDEDEEDKEKDKDSDVDKDDGDDSDSENEKENNTAGSNDEDDEPQPDGENKRRKLQELRGSDNDNICDETKPKEMNESFSGRSFRQQHSKDHKWTQSKLNRVKEEYNVLSCEILLNDCVELYHNSPDKEVSFFKYLKLEKKSEDDDDVEIEGNESENRVNETLEAKRKDIGSEVKDELGSSLNERKGKVNRELKNAKRKLGAENSPKDETQDENGEKAKNEGEHSQSIKIKSEVEDQDGIVTSTTQEMEDEDRTKSNEENNMKSATCGSLNDSNGDSTGCVTSSVPGSQPVYSEEFENNDENDRTKTEHSETKTEDVEDKTEERCKTQVFETQAECDTEINNVEGTDADLVSDTEDSRLQDDNSIIAEDHEQTFETIEDESYSKEVTESDKSNEHVMRTESMDDFNIPDLLPKLEDFIDKEKLKLLIDVDENVDEVYTHLEHCQVELKATDIVEDVQIELTAVDVSDSVVDNESNDERDDNESSNKRDSEENDSDSDIMGKPKKSSKKRKKRISSSKENDSQSEDSESSRITRKRRKQVTYKEPEGSDTENENIKEKEEETSETSDKPKESSKKRKKRVSSSEENGSQSEDSDESSRRTRKRRKQVSYKEPEGSDDTDNENIKESKDETNQSSDDDDAACGLPVKKQRESKPKSTNKKSTNKSKPGTSSTRKARKSTSEEEEEEEISAKSDDSEDEDFNPYEEARAIRDMRVSKKSSSRNKRRSGSRSHSKGGRQWSSPQLATNVPHNASVGGVYNLQSYNYQPRAPLVGRAGRNVGPASQTMGPSSRMGPASRNVGPASRMGPAGRTMGPGNQTMGPASRTMGPGGQTMGPSSRMGPASRNVGPASQTRGPSNRMGPASRTMGPGSQTMGPTSRMGMHQVGGGGAPNTYQYGGVTITPKVVQPPVNPLPTMKNVTITRKNEMPSSTSQGYRPGPNMGPAGAQRARMGPNMGPSGFQRPPYGPASAPNRANIGLRPQGQVPRNISQENSNKTRIKGGVQIQRNSMQASQMGGVNNLRKESHIHSKQRVGGALHEQKIHMKHTVNQDASSGAGQDTRVTSNIRKTVTQDGRQVIHRVKKIITTNIEIEEIEIDPGEVINLD